MIGHSSITAWITVVQQRKIYVPGTANDSHRSAQLLFQHVTSDKAPRNQCSAARCATQTKPHCFWCTRNTWGWAEHRFSLTTFLKSKVRKLFFPTDFAQFSSHRIKPALWCLLNILFGISSCSHSGTQIYSVLCNIFLPSLGTNSAFIRSSCYKNKTNVLDAKASS